MKYIIVFIAGMWLGKKYQLALKWEKGLSVEYKNSQKARITKRLFSIG